MHLHTQKTFKYLDSFLPKQYSERVVERMEKKGRTITKEIVQNVRNKKSLDKNIDVLAVLVELAEENEAALKLLNEHNQK